MDTKAITKKYRWNGKGKEKVNIFHAKAYLSAYMEFPTNE